LGIVDGAETRVDAILLIGAPAEVCADAGHLHAFVEIEEDVEDGVVVLDFDYGAVGVHANEAVVEDIPFVGAVKIVHHEKAAAIEILTELPALRIRETPVSDLNGVDPRVIEYFVAIEVNDLFHGSGMNAAQSADTLEELAVGLGIVGGPTA